MSIDFDIVIVGGGLTGISLALALSQTPFKIALVEATSPAQKPTNITDGRSIALSLASQRIFDTLGCWSVVEAHATAIKKIHVSQERGAVSMLDAAEHHVPAFGYTIPIYTLLDALESALNSHPRLTRFCPASVTHIEPAAAQSHVTLSQDGTEKKLTTRLIIACDGQRSALRESLGIKITEAPLTQAALVSTLECNHSHDNIAYERFIPEPIALLPLLGKKMGLVWAHDLKHSDAFKTKSDAELIAELQSHLGYRIGRITNIGKRFIMPLYSMTAHEQIRPGIVLMGHAAHVLHPVAAQGFNLSLRDNAALAEILVDAERDGQLLGSMAVLKNYADWRATDQQQISRLTHGLTSVFKKSLRVMQPIRDMSLLGFDINPFLKNRFVRVSMGLNGRVPRLACGQKL